MIVKEIINLVADQLQERNESVIRKIKEWIYNAQQDMIRLHSFKVICYITEFYGDGNNEYPLPVIFSKLVNQSPVKINNKPVANICSNIYNDRTYEIQDYVTWDSKVKAQSSTNTDYNNKVVVFDGYNDSRGFIELYGTTEQMTNESFDRISYVYKEKTEGVVTIKNEDESISFDLGQGDGDYGLKSIRFNQEIGSTEKISVAFVKQVKKLQDEYAFDELLANYGDVISLYCLYRGFMSQEDDSQAREMYQLYNTELIKIIKEDKKQKRINNFYTFIPRKIT